MLIFTGTYAGDFTNQHLIADHRGPQLLIPRPRFNKTWLAVPAPLVTPIVLMLVLIPAPIVTPIVLMLVLVPAPIVTPIVLMLVLIIIVSHLSSLLLLLR
jgi:hypothetical protein